MSELTASCPHCQKDITIDTAYAGKAMACPLCGGQFEAPDVPAPVAAPAPRLVVPASRNAAAPPPQQQYAPPPQQRQAPAPAPGYLPQQAQGYAPPPQQAAPQMAGYPGYPMFGRVDFGEVLMDPLEAQPRFIQTGGTKRAALWGWFLFLICIVAAWAVSWRNEVVMMANMPGEMPSIGFAQHFEWIVAAADPLAVFMLALVILNAMNGNRAKFGAVVFTAGVAFLPPIFFALAAMVLLLISSDGIQMGTEAGALVHAIAIVGVFIVAGLVLLVKASLVSVLGYTRRAAFWLVPTVLIVVGYVSNWIFGLVDKIHQ